MDARKWFHACRGVCWTASSLYLKLLKQVPFRITAKKTEEFKAHTRHLEKTVSVSLINIYIQEHAKQKSSEADQTFALVSVLTAVKA